MKRCKHIWKLVDFKEVYGESCLCLVVEHCENCGKLQQVKKRYSRDDSNYIKAYNDRKCSVCGFIHEKQIAPPNAYDCIKNLADKVRNLQESLDCTKARL